VIKIHIKIKYQANYSIYITIIDSKNNLKEIIYSHSYTNCFKKINIIKTIRKNLMLKNRYITTIISKNNKIEYYTKNRISLNPLLFLQLNISEKR